MRNHVGNGGQRFESLVLRKLRTVPNTVTNYLSNFTNEPQHEFSNNVVCATRKASDQPVRTRNLIGVFASRLNIL